MTELDLIQFGRAKDLTSVAFATAKKAIQDGDLKLAHEAIKDASAYIRIMEMVVFSNVANYKTRSELIECSKRLARILDAFEELEYQNKTVEEKENGGKQ